MQHVGTGFLLSATDLARFSGCAQRTWLDRLKALGLATPDHFDDPRLDLLRQRGYEHERALLEDFEREGKRVVRFPPLAKDERCPEGWARRAAETLEAMRAGPDVIYQGTLYDGRWLGFPDFLIREERPSDLGAWSYEVADAKLAREAKAQAVLQTCVYSAMLARVQCTEPERLHLYLGGPSRGRSRSGWRTSRPISARSSGGWTRTWPTRRTSRPSRPIRWSTAGSATGAHAASGSGGRWIISRSWRGSLGISGGRSRRRACTRSRRSRRLPLDAPPDGLRAASFQRIREQARVQLEGRRRGAPYHEALPVEPNGDGPPLGLAALPAPTSRTGSSTSRARTTPTSTGSSTCGACLLFLPTRLTSTGRSGR
jgi:hypothetical protein